MQILTRDHQIFGTTKEEIDFIGALIGAAVITYFTSNIQSKELKTKAQ